MFFVNPSQNKIRSLNMSHCKEFLDFNFIADVLHIAESPADEGNFPVVEGISHGQDRKFIRIISPHQYSSDFI
jgi:hypothetical protein